MPTAIQQDFAQLTQVNPTNHKGLKRDFDNEYDEEEDEPAPKRAGRRKIKIEYIEDKSRRHITFSKRKVCTCWWKCIGDAVGTLDWRQE